MVKLDKKQNPLNYFVVIKKIMPFLIILGIAVLGSGVTQPWKFIEILLVNELIASLQLALSTSFKSFEFSRV